MIARREDYLSYKKTRGLPVCIDNELETYESERTLVNADSDTLEIRSDKQTVKKVTGFIRTSPFQKNQVYYAIS